MKKIIPMALGVIWLAGCSQQPPLHAEQQAIRDNAPCCATIETLPAQQFGSQRSLTLTFSEQTPQVHFAERSVAAQVVQLPVASRPFTLELTVPLTDDRFLVPQVVLYDASWQPLQTAKPADFTYRKPYFLHRHRLQSRIDVLEGMSKARWLVVYAAASQEPERYKLVAESEIYAEKTQTEPPLELAKYALSANTGQLVIRINPHVNYGDVLLNGINSLAE